MTIAGSKGSVTTPEVATPAKQDAQSARAAQETALAGLFDIRSLYLAVIACGLAAFTIAQLVRFLGVRT